MRFFLEKSIFFNFFLIKQSLYTIILNYNWYKKQSTVINFLNVKFENASASVKIEDVAFIQIFQTLHSFSNMFKDLVLDLVLLRRLVFRLQCYYKQEYLNSKVSLNSNLYYFNCILKITFFKNIIKYTEKMK